MSASKAAKVGDQIQGILPYTLIPKTADKPCVATFAWFLARSSGCGIHCGACRASIAFLLWKDRKASVTQSATYWADINCEKARGSCARALGLTLARVCRPRRMFRLPRRCAARSARRLRARSLRRRCVALDTTPWT